MNRKKPTGPLKPAHCKALNHAWHQAAKDGYPLNALISIRPPENLTLLEHAELVDKTWNRLAVWSRRHTAGKTFHCILTRETKPINNFHALMHVESAAQLGAIRHALARWFPAPGAAHVRRAHQGEGCNRFGKVQSVLGYITKERTPQAAWPRWQYRQGSGTVLGKRYRITANLRSRPSDIAASRPIRRTVTTATV